MPPKVHLKADRQLLFEYTLAKDLGKTHHQLLQELGPSELAYWRATYEIESEQYQDALRAAEQKARSDRVDQEVLKKYGKHR